MHKRLVILIRIIRFELCRSLTLGLIAGLDQDGHCRAFIPDDLRQVKSCIIIKHSLAAELDITDDPQQMVLVLLVVAKRLLIGGRVQDLGARGHL